jgi:hypothetical protein
MVIRVNELYEKIFNQDPLLLDEENQRIFGAQILENLLVERGVKSTLPQLVALDSKASIDAFGRRDFWPETINEELKQRYVRSVRTRTPLDDEDVEKLKTVTMAVNANYTEERKLNAFADHDKAAASIEQTDSPLDKRIRIAAVGYRVSISRLEDAGELHEELCPMPPNVDKRSLTGLPENKRLQKLRRTTLRDQEKQPEWREIIRKHVVQALDRKSHLIVLPEFALPPNLEEFELERCISEAAAGHTHTYFLFSGTRHEGAYNRGFIVVHPRRKERPREREQWWHYKTASARGLGENIMGPQNGKIPSYKFTIPSPANPRVKLEYRIFIPICYDIFDPTTFINYVAGCADADGRFRQSIIIVPSFNPGREFVHALRDLSFIASCPVIYVNGLHGDAKLFLYGVAASDLADIDLKTVKKGKVRADDSIEAGLARLTKELDDTTHAYDRLDEVIDYGPELHDSIESQKVHLSSRRLELEARRDALKNFSADLDAARSRGALRHLVTTEACSDCGRDDHGAAAYCPRDILYYNLDIELLAALNRFRNKYFGPENFLPSPFTQDGKKRIRAIIKDENDRQQHERARRALQHP